MALLAAADTGQRPPCGFNRNFAKEASELFTQALIPCFELTLSPKAHQRLGKKKRQFVRATFTYGGVTLHDVGVRFKGHRSLQGWDEKPAFKLNFGKFSKQQRFLGLEKLTLNNLVEDPTLLSEALGYELYRAARVPAPRVGYAEVVVNGTSYGLYANIESIDESFLEQHFGSSEGELYEGEYGCDVRAPDVFGFEQESGDEDRPGLRRLAQAADANDKDLFFGKAAPLDTKRVLDYLAVSAFIGDTDGYRHSHNYRIYYDPSVNRATFLPWGIDRVFRKSLDIFDSDGRVAELCFADLACRRAYAAEMEAVTRTFERLDLKARAEVLAAFLARAGRRDQRKPYDSSETERERRKLKDFLGRRAAEVRKQLACFEEGMGQDRDGDGYDCKDCNDADPNVHPGSEELCDGIDNDCSGLVDDGARCECEQLDVGKAAFRLCAHPFTFEEARTFCQAQGHVLARFETKEQAEKVHRALKKQDRARSWIGLRDRDGDGSFEWEDDAPFEFSNWAKGEPDSKGCSPRCAAFREKGKGRWFSTHCSVRRPFVCRERSSAE